MGKFIEKFRRFRVRQEIRSARRRVQREVRENIREQNRKIAARQEIKRQIRIAEVREAQLRRARAEAGILQAKAKRFKAQRQIAPPLKIIAPSRGLTIRPFNPTQVVRKITKKKKGKGLQVSHGTPGLGTSFRVL